MWGHGQHTLLGIVVGLCGASGNTLYWVLLLVYMGPRATHITGYCCWFMWGLGQHTLLNIVVDLCGASGNTLYFCWVIQSFGQHTLLGIIVRLLWVFSNWFKIIFF
jgi:hypothetical protein